MEQIPPRPTAWTRRAFLIAAGLVGVSAAAWFRSRRTDAATDAIAPSPGPVPMTKAASGQVPVFYTPAYVGAAHAFETTRKARWVAESLRQAPIAGLHLNGHASLDATDVLRAHSPEYVDAVRTGEPRRLAESQGFAWDAGLWPMVLASNGGVLAAARAARGQGVAGALASGLHHARREHGAGFCTFNGLAIAAHTLLAEGVRRILIVDLDAHCGGGTHSLIEGVAGLRQLDIAVDAFDHYSPAAGNTLDLLDAATDYLPTLRRRLAARNAELRSASERSFYEARLDALTQIANRFCLEEDLKVLWARSRRYGHHYSLAIPNSPSIRRTLAMARGYSSSGRCSTRP